MTKIRKKRMIMLFASLLVMMVFIGCLRILMVNTKAEESLNRPISRLLDEYDISYSEASVRNHVLSVSLLSEGEGRCTLNDVKSIMCVYSAVHGNTIDGEVNDINIKIYDRNGDLIYDASEKDVSSPVYGLENQNGIMDAQDNKSEQDTLETVIEIISSYNYSIEKTSRIKALEVQGNRLEITLSQDIFDFRALDNVFDRLESLFAKGGEYAQCEITMVNTARECVYYMAEDFAFGSRIAWISPSAERAFLEQVGPRRD